MEPIDGTYRDTLTHQRDFHEKRESRELFLCSTLPCSSPTDKNENNVNFDEKMTRTSDSRSSVRSASGSGSVSGCGGWSVPSSSLRPDTTATTESKKDPYANLKSNGVGIGVPLITATTVGSSNCLLRPSSQSSMDGLQRFNVYNRLDVSSSPGGNKS